MSTWQKTTSRRLLTAEVLDTTPANTRAAFDTEGYDQVTLLFALTRAAATRVDCVVEVSPDNSTWYLLETKSIASGVATLSDEDNQKAVSGSTNWALNYDINWPWMRISIDATAATTDTLTVDVLLGRKAK